MIITGNVQVSSTHLTLGRDLILPTTISDDSLAPFVKLAQEIHSSCPETSPLAIMQLSHAGRQSSNFLGGRHPSQKPLAPSAIRLQSKDGSLLSSMFHHALFQTPHAMSLREIDQVVDQFVNGAMVALRSGFDGIELHAAHGCEY